MGHGAWGMGKPFILTHSPPHPLLFWLVQWDIFAIGVLIRRKFSVNLNKPQILEAIRRG